MDFNMDQVQELLNKGIGEAKDLVQDPSKHYVMLREQYPLSFPTRGKRNGHTGRASADHQDIRFYRCRDAHIR